MAMIIKIWAALVLCLQCVASLRPTRARVAPSGQQRRERGLRVQPLGDGAETAVSEVTGGTEAPSSSSSSELSLASSGDGDKQEEDDGEFLSLSRGGTAQLKTLMEKMPLEEKYSLLLQSYASSAKGG